MDVLRAAFLGSEHIGEYNFTSWSVAESVTSLDPANYSGGSPQITLTVPYDKTLRTIMGAEAIVDSSKYGTLIGNVRNLRFQGKEFVTIVIDHSYALLNSWQTTKPYEAFLSEIYADYFAQANVYPPIVSAAADTVVTYPALQNNMYDIMKQSLAVQGLEMTAANDIIQVGRRRTDRRTIANMLQVPSWDVDSQNAAEKVRAHFYSNEYITQRRIYPTSLTTAERKLNPESEESEPQIFSVDASETLEVELQLRTSVASVYQPTYAEFVPDNPDVGQGTGFPTGVYTAVGNDGLPITPAQWAAEGGDLEVVPVEEDASKVVLRIKGPRNPNFAPYRIAMSSGAGNYYNALHLVGSGVAYDDDFIDIYTGGQENLSGQEIGTEITNTLISTKSQAVSTGQYTAATHSLSVILSGGAFIEFGDGGPSAAFGNVAGSRIQVDDTVFRIMDATFGPEGIQFSAVDDTLVSDFNQLQGEGMSMAEFNARWENEDVTSFNLSALKVQND